MASAEQAQNDPTTPTTPTFNQPPLPQTPVVKPRLASVNPYAGHAGLHQVEGEVLAEYARMAKSLDQMATLVGNLSTSQPEILERLRPVERKLGLVLTLFKASVWAHLVAKEAKEEEEEMVQEEMRRRQEFEHQKNQFRGMQQQQQQQRGGMGVPRGTMSAHAENDEIDDSRYG